MLKQKITGSVQEVILPDFPDDDDNTVTTTVTKSRRVSFGPNFVKEFIVDSAITAQYEHAFPSSDSSDTAHGTAHGTFLLQDNLKLHKSVSEENHPKPPKFASTICFSANSPTADMEFTEGCITLARSILEKKNKEMTVFIQAKPEGPKEEDETSHFEGSEFEMSSTTMQSFRSKERKRFAGEKTRIFGKSDDEMSVTRCERFHAEEEDEDEDESKENRMPLDAIMRYLDKNDSDSDLFNPEKPFGVLLGVELSDESENLDLNESMELSEELNVPVGRTASEVPSGGLSENERFGANHETEAAEEMTCEEITPQETREKMTSLETREKISPLETREMITPEETREMTSLETREKMTSLDTREKMTSLKTRENITPQETREDIKPEEIREKIPPLETRETMTSLETREKLASLETREKITPQETREIKTPEETREKMTSLETCEKMTSLETREKITPEETRETMTSLETREKIPPLETREKMTSLETCEKMTSLETLEKITPEETRDEMTFLETREKMASLETHEKMTPLETREKMTSLETREKMTPEETREKITSQETRQMTSLETREMMAPQESLPEETLTEDLMDTEPSWNPPPFTRKSPPTTPQGSIKEDDTLIEPTLGDLKVIESLKEQAREKGCVWTLRDVHHPRRRSLGSLSFSCRLLDSTASLRFSLRMSDEDSLDCCSSVTDSSVLLDEDDECRVPEYALAVAFGYHQLKKQFGTLQGVASLRHVPYYMDRVNCFLSRMNGYLRQVQTVLTSYPGSRLQGCQLSFRLFSFPVFLSCVVSIDLSDVSRLSGASLSFDHDFGCLDEKKVEEMFEASLKEEEDALCGFVVRATRYLVEEERALGYVSKRRHIRLLPEDLKGTA